MSDMSICPHGDAVGYCDICSPNWERDLFNAGVQDTIYAAGIKRGRSELEASLSASQAREAELREKLETVSTQTAHGISLTIQSALRNERDEYKQRAEAAEAKIKASQEQESVLLDVANERLRQHAKWDGVFDDTKYTPLDWHEMIADYNGWARRMACMGSYDKARNRYVQIAALAVAAVEAIDTNYPLLEAKKGV